MLFKHFLLDCVSQVLVFTLSSLRRAKARKQPPTVSFEAIQVVRYGVCFSQCKRLSGWPAPIGNVYPVFLMLPKPVEVIRFFIVSRISNGHSLFFHKQAVAPGNQDRSLAAPCRGLTVSPPPSRIALSNRHAQGCYIRYQWKGTRSRGASTHSYARRYATFQFASVREPVRVRMWTRSYWRPQGQSLSKRCALSMQFLGRDRTEFRGTAGPRHRLYLQQRGQYKKRLL